MFSLKEVILIFTFCLAGILLDGVDEEEKDSKLLSFIDAIIKQEGIELLNIVDLRENFH